MRTWLLIALALLAFAAPPVVAGDVLFSNLGANGSFQSGGNRVGLLSGGLRRIAVPFNTPPVRAFAFDAFEAPIFGADALVRVTLAADDNGAPGTVIAHYVQRVGPAAALYRWSSDQKPVLDGGRQYWIIAPSLEVTELLWPGNFIGQLGGGLQSTAFAAWSPLDADRLAPAYRVTVVAAVGACCIPSAGKCVVTTVEQCDAAGMQFGGHLSVCSPEFCPPQPPSRACCGTAGNCVVTTQTICQSLGGTWFAGSPACTLLPCTISLPSGACCQGATCQFTSGLICPIIGGRYLGNNSTCAPVGGVNICCPTDVNNSGDVTVQDLFDFLARFFSGCT